MVGGRRGLGVLTKLPESKVQHCSGPFADAGVAAHFARRPECAILEWCNFGIGLYLHIHLLQLICILNFNRAFRSRLKLTVCRALEAEIRRAGAAQWSDTIFCGGGTPSRRPEEIGRLIGAAAPSSRCRRRHITRRPIGDLVARGMERSGRTCQ